MSDLPLPERYLLALIDEIVQTTLKGRSALSRSIKCCCKASVSTGEIFERALGDRITATQYQVDTQTDELKQARQPAA